MQFVNALNPKRIALQIHCEDRTQALAKVADMFAECDERLDATLVNNALLRREMLASTNLGNGVAIPHFRIPDLGEPHFVIATIREGVDFEDGVEPVKTIFAFLFDDADTTSHLNILMQLARVLQNPTLRDRIADAEHTQDILEALAFGRIDYSTYLGTDCILPANVPVGHA